MDRSIFSSIVSYIPTERINPQENFLTELFAWIINNVSGFGYEFISYAIGYLNQSVNIDEYAIINASTQITVSSGYIDMVVYTDMGINFICEHKIDSELSRNQIQKYIDCKNQLEGEGEYYTLLLTKAKWQHTQPADISFVWADIDALVERIAVNYPDDSKEYFVLKQFSLYLKEQGLGRVEPMDTDYIRNDYLKERDNASKIDGLLVSLFNELATIDWKDIIPGIESFRVAEGYEPQYQVKREGIRWGRVGIRFFSNWKPSVFAGVLLDCSDHRLEFSGDGRGPDFVVLLDIDNSLNKSFNEIEWTKNMKDRLADNHAPFNKFVRDPKNPWRLAVLQRPFYDVVKDASTYEEQKERIIAAIKEGVELFINS